MTDDRPDREGLRELRALTERLPREMDPPAGAWEAVRAQMARDESGFTQPPGRPALWQRPEFLVAAALLLVAGSSAVTYLGFKDRAAPMIATGPVVAPNAAATAVSTLAQFTGRENEYLRRVNGLVAIMESSDAELAPETVAKVKASLAVIDAAILEARAALAGDPANRALVEMLESTYEMKLDLLQRTTEMARS